MRNLFVESIVYILFWAKLANFAPKGSRRDNAQKSAANRNTGEKDNA